MGYYIGSLKMSSEGVLKDRSFQREVKTMSHEHEGQPEVMKVSKEQANPYTPSWVWWMLGTIIVGIIVICFAIFLVFGRGGDACTIAPEAPAAKQITAKTSTCVTPIVTVTQPDLKPASKKIGKATKGSCRGIDGKSVTHEGGKILKMTASECVNARARQMSPKDNDRYNAIVGN